MKIIQLHTARAQRLARLAGLQPSQSPPSLRQMEAELSALLKRAAWTRLPSLCLRLLEACPGHRQALNLLARDAARSGRLKDVRRWQRRWVEQLHQSGPAWMFYEALAAALRLDPESLELRELGLGHARRERDFPQAMAMALGLARIGAQAGQTLQAIELLRALQTEFAEEPEVPLQLAEFHLLEGNIQQARAALRQAGQQFSQRGQLDRAILAYQRKLVVIPHSLLARLRLAELFLLSGLPAQAAAACREVLQSDLGHLEALRLLALACLELGDDRQALLAARRYLEHRPEDEEILAVMARARSRKCLESGEPGRPTGWSDDPRQFGSLRLSLREPGRQDRSQPERRQQAN